MEATKASIMSHVVTMRSKAVEAVTLVKQAAVKVTTPVTSRIAQAAAALHEVPGRSLGSLVAVRQGVAYLAASSYEDIAQQGLRPWAYSVASSAREDASARASCAVKDAKAKTAEFVAIAREYAADSSVRTSAATAAGGAVALGASGGAVGFTAGGAVGAALGAVPAVFTFGLSIPVGAALGAGAGLLAGAATGATAGVVGGGVAGYGYSKQDELKDAASQAVALAAAKAELVRVTAKAKVGDVKDRISTVQARVVGKSSRPMSPLTTAASTASLEDVD